MNFTIYQTVTDGVTRYLTDTTEGARYSSAVELSFTGIREPVACNDEPLYALYYDRRASLARRMRDALPKGVYPVNIYKRDARVGSVGFCRGHGGRLFRYAVENRAFTGYMFTSANNRATVYLYEDGALQARIDRPRRAADDRTVYNVWVNDSVYLPKLDPNDVTGKQPKRPDTYALYPEIRFLADAAAVFAIYFDTVTLLPFGEFEYAANTQTLRGLRRSSLRFNCENDYTDIVSPREEPLPPEEPAPEQPPEAEDACAPTGERKGIGAFFSALFGKGKKNAEPSKPEDDASGEAEPDGGQEPAQEQNGD